MEYPDYYKTLGVERDATNDEIKKNYRRLARKYHPDVSKEANAEEKFKEVKEAYEVLKDSEKRKAYDQFGSQWKQGQGFQPPPGWQYERSQRPDTQTFNDSGFSDFFEAIFGQGRAHGGFEHAESFKTRGQDQHSKITIGLEDAFHGLTTTISLREPIINPQTGQMIYQDRSLKVKIPRGVSEGQQIRLAGQGSQGMSGGPRGDLYLEIHLRKHPLYSVKKHDLYLNLPVTPWETALGATITIPTLSGQVELKIPPGSQSGQKLRLKGKGLPSKQPGDLYVILSIHTPLAKTDTEKALYQQMEQEMHFNPRVAMKME